jgi:probable O-glycosylation ligase (exosortase A-associated)
MRDIAVTLAVFGILPFILKWPYIGILAWSWLAYMNPHRMAWGFSTTMPFAFMVALCTLAGMLMSREPKRIPWTRETVLLLVFILWMFITTVYSLYPWLAWEQWDKVWRIMLMTYVTMMLINNKERIDLLMTVIALSLAFYGVKGGIFVLTTGGVHRVQGPDSTFIGGNNELGLALIMTVPLLRYVQLHATHYWIRQGLSGVIGLVLIAIVGTHSRGALVGLAAMSLFFLLKTRKKVGAILVAIPLALVLLYVMPQSWFDRMHTIETYEEDGSAQGRLYAWRNAITLANEHSLGGGFRAVTGYGGTDSHSIYFGVLGEQGWVGLAMFLLLILFTWRSASWIIRHSKKNPDLYWTRDLAAMIQVSLIGYMSAGAFLGLQYFDLFYHLMVIIVMTKLLVKEQVEPKPALGFTGSAAPMDAALPKSANHPGAVRHPSLAKEGNVSAPSSVPLSLAKEENISTPLSVPLSRKREKGRG